MFTEKDTREFGDWLHSLFSRRPRLVLWAAILFLSAGLTYLSTKERESERDRVLTILGSAEASQQVQRIESIRSALKDLDAFLGERAARMATVQATLDQLQSERDRLAPLVKADRDIIDSILAAQAERARSNVWSERLYGFVAGLLSSLLAAWLAFVIARVWKRVGQKNGEPGATDNPDGA